MIQSDFVQDSTPNNRVEVIEERNTQIHQIEQNQITIDNQNFKTLFSQGQQLLEKSNFEKANFYFDQALIINPNDYKCQFQKGQILFQLNQLQEALHWFNTALSQQPNNVRLLYLQYKCLLKMGQYDGAKQQSKYLLKLISNGIEQYSKNEKLIIIRWLDELKKKPKNIIRILFCKVQTLMGDKKFDEAIECANIILTINPQQYQSIAQIGQSLMKLGKHNEALIQIEKALNINQNDQKVILIKGSLLTNICNFNEAIKWLSLIENNQKSKNLIEYCKLRR